MVQEQTAHSTQTTHSERAGMSATHGFFKSATAAVVVWSTNRSHPPSCTSTVGSQSTSTTSTITITNSLVPGCDERHHPQWLPAHRHPELLHAYINGAVLPLIQLLSQTSIVVKAASNIILCRCCGAEGRVVWNGGVSAVSVCMHWGQQHQLLAENTQPANKTLLPAATSAVPPPAPTPTANQQQPPTMSHSASSMGFPMSCVS